MHTETRSERERERQEARLDGGREGGRGCLGEREERGMSINAYEISRSFASSLHVIRDHPIGPRMRVWSELVLLEFASMPIMWLNMYALNIACYAGGQHLVGSLN